MEPVKESRNERKERENKKNARKLVKQEQAKKSW